MPEFMKFDELVYEEVLEVKGIKKGKKRLEIPRGSQYDTV
jgi:hypothetical protein